MVSFLASAVQVVCGTITSFLEDGSLNAFFFLVCSAANIVLAFVWVYGFICRFTHDGEVCSGDFLSTNDSTEGYLIAQG